MYIIWKGRGFFVLVVVLAIHLFLQNQNVDEALLFSYTMFISAPVVYLLGLYFNYAADQKAMKRAEEGEISTFKQLARKSVHDVFGDPASRPAFFFIPMVWWGAILLILGAIDYFDQKADAAQNRVNTEKVAVKQMDRKIKWIYGGNVKGIYRIGRWGDEYTSVVAYDPKKGTYSLMFSQKNKSSKPFVRFEQMAVSVQDTQLTLENAEKCYGDQCIQNGKLSSLILPLTDGDLQTLQKGSGLVLGFESEGSSEKVEIPLYGVTAAVNRMKQNASKESKN